MGITPYTSSAIQSANFSTPITTRPYGMPPSVSEILIPKGEERLLLDRPSGLIGQCIMRQICPDMTEDTWFARACRFVNSFFDCPLPEEQKEIKAETSRIAEDRDIPESHFCAYESDFPTLNSSDPEYTANNTARRKYWVVGGFNPLGGYFDDSVTVIEMTVRPLSYYFHDVPDSQRLSPTQARRTQCIAEALSYIDPRAQRFSIPMYADDENYKEILNLIKLPPKMFNTTMTCESHDYSYLETSCFRPEYDHGVGHFCNKKWRPEYHDGIVYSSDGTTRSFSLNEYEITVLLYDFNLLYPGADPAERYGTPYGIPNSRCYGRLQSALLYALLRSNCWDELSMGDTAQIEKLVCYPKDNFTTTTTMPIPTQSTNIAIDLGTNHEKFIVTVTFLSVTAILAVVTQIVNRQRLHREESRQLDV